MGDYSCDQCCEYICKCDGDWSPYERMLQEPVQHKTCTHEGDADDAPCYPDNPNLLCCDCEWYRVPNNKPSL